MKPQNPQNALFSNVKRCPVKEAPANLSYLADQTASTTLLMASTG